MGIGTFWVEKLAKQQWSYTCREIGPCPVHGEYHRAEKAFPADVDSAGSLRELCPESCDCGHRFGDSLDIRSGHGRSFWRRMDTGVELSNPLSPGACYVDPNPVTGWIGPDGLSIVCVLPNGSHWWIDSRASNCTMPADDVHKCWVRHGTVGERLHVDKNGVTCQAGAGSIMSGDYHGFLHNGELI